MSLTIDKIKNDIVGTQRVVIADLTFDDSYPTGGESVDLGLNVVNFATLNNPDGYVAEYDYANNKIIMYYADYDAVADGALIQVADTSDLSTVVMRVKLEGQ